MLSEGIMFRDGGNWPDAKGTGKLSDPGTKPASLVPPALAGRFFTTSTTLEVVGRRGPEGCLRLSSTVA